MKNKTLKKKTTLENIADSIDKLEIKLGKKIDEKIDDLAMFTAKGFKDLDERLSVKIDNVEEKLNSKIKNIEKTLGAQIVGLDNKIDDLNFHKVRDEVYLLTKRIAKVESKVGIKN